LDPAPASRHTLSLHDALPILEACHPVEMPRRGCAMGWVPPVQRLGSAPRKAVGPRKRHKTPFLRGRGRKKCLEEGVWRRTGGFRSEEHTSELQSRENLVCRLL